MTKRLFVSISLPGALQDTLAEYCKKFSVRDVQWTPKGNIHITACFLGDVDETHSAEINKKIKEVCARIEPFSLSFENISFAPPGMPPRMVWAMFAPSDAYRRFLEEIQETLQIFLTVEPHKEAIPHATLARFKNPALAKEIDITRPPLELSSFDVRSVELMESRLDSTGVRYETLETFLFGGA